MPTKYHISETFLGGCMSRIAQVFAGSAFTPCLLTMCPRNFNSDFENSHLLGLSVTPVVSIRFKTFSSMFRLIFTKY